MVPLLNNKKAVLQKTLKKNFLIPGRNPESSRRLQRRPGHGLVSLRTRKFGACQHLYQGSGSHAGTLNGFFLIFVIRGQFHQT